MTHSLTIEPPIPALPQTMGRGRLGCFYLVNTNSGVKKACVRINRTTVAFFSESGGIEWSDTPNEYTPIRELGRIRLIQS